VPDEYVKKVFATMVKADWHIFQILTKRAERLVKLAPQLPWPSHIWQGVSVESQTYTKRVTALEKVPAAVRFLSVEPLLGPIGNLPLNGVHWVIVGGESGPRHRPIRPEWVREIRKQCLVAEVPFFFKQWGGRTPKSGGRILDGKTWDQMPTVENERSLFFRLA
jgi:protein gp37